MKKVNATISVTYHQHVTLIVKNDYNDRDLRFAAREQIQLPATDKPEWLEDEMEVVE